MKRNPALPTHTLRHARQLRGAQTDAELRLWYHLRAGRLGGYKFRRQYPLPPYIADFACIAEKLIVELDGSQHTPENDQPRTQFLQQHGWKVLRLWDNDVLNNTDAVLTVILQHLER